jgi:lysophospholipase L1-like esterase
MQLDLWKSIMFKSSRKKLIAIGCSYTEHNLTSINSPDVDFDFPRWPQHLADMLDMDCVNLGRSGSGNDQILAKTVDVVLNEKNIGLVVLMWSEWQRVNFQRYKDQSVWHHIRPYASSTDDHNLVDETWRKIWLSLSNTRHATRQTLRQFIHAEKLLRDLPYLFIQGTFNLPFYSTTKLKTIDCGEGTPYEKRNFSKVNNSRRMTTNEIIISPYFDYIEKNIGDKFIGWPIMHEIGGYSIDNILDKEDPERLKYRISEDDSHPNAAGHKFIADFLCEQYKEIYNDY